MSNSKDESIWAIASHPLSIAKMLSKQKLLFVTVWLAITIPGIFVISRIPAVYRAEMMILVDTEKIPDKYVSTTSSTTLRERLDKLSQDALSSARLAKIIEKFNLYPNLRKTYPLEDVAAMMRSDVHIQFENTTLGEERPGRFRVSYQGSDPVTVADVTNEVGNLLVSTNVKNREVHAEDTEQFIQSQVEQAKRSLDEQEQRVGQYKIEHNGELPEQAAVLTTNLSQLGDQIHANQDAISRAYSTQATLKSGIQLAKTLAAMSERQEKRVKPADPNDADAADALPERPEDVRKELEAELAAALQQYTEAHPKVKRLRATIARIKSLEEQQQTVAAYDPEHTEDLKAQLAAIDREVKQRTEENRRLTHEMQLVQAHLAALPLRAQELATFTRDYEIGRENYKNLLDKLHDAQMEADMERRHKSERFTILSPAGVPGRPVRPNRPLLFGWAAMLGLLVGVIAALVREARKNTILGEWELPAGTVIYGRVPRIGTTVSVNQSVSQMGRLASIRSVMNRRIAAGRVQRVEAKAIAMQPEKDVIVLPVAAGAGGQTTSAISSSARKPAVRIRPASPALCLDDSDLRVLDQYRLARTKLELDPREPKFIAVTSACEGDGKTISAINLARAFAMRRDVRILLVGGDFRHPSLPDLLGISAQPGVADVLTGACQLSDAIINVEQLPGLYILPSGGHVANAAELLNTSAWQSLCNSFRDQFTYIIIDTPPIGCVADYDLIEKSCDGAMMVVRPDHTDRGLFRLGYGLVSPHKLLGVLMNDVEDWFLWKTTASSYGYYTVPAPDAKRKTS